MGDRGRSERNFTGGYTHYDSKGHKTGRSEPNLFGGYTNYDAKGHKVGRTEENFFGGYTTYDSHGRKIGTTEENLFGGYTHRDANRKVVGKSDPNAFSGGYSHNSSNSEGCYVATCVYGSYDCPEVWTLRRFRDYCLDTTWYGRLFIKCYYKISPTLVKWFGDTRWFKNMWEPVLNKMVNKLQEKGYESTAYKDKSIEQWNRKKVRKIIRKLKG